MRKKYLPIYAVAFFLLAFGLAGFYAYLVLTNPLRVKPVSPAKPVPALLVPDEQTLDEMAKLEKQMGRLLQPVPEKMEPVNLKLFGYEPVREGKLKHGRGGPGLLRENMHLLTMAFKGMTKGFCVIDGTFYPQGASLPDGSIIRRVERNRVLLVKRNRKIWIDMGKEALIQELKASKTGERK
ncbi:MAG: hypothetical protein JRI80_09630 [Deltaproteobacteria bacterium]|nr:hypothetical protein [Deltaproteobacteria bacterium]